MALLLSQKFSPKSTKVGQLFEKGSVQKQHIFSSAQSPEVNRHTVNIMSSAVPPFFPIIFHNRQQGVVGLAGLHKLKPETSKSSTAKVINCHHKRTLLN